MDRDDPAYRGQSDYTPSVLRMYDPFVLGFAARFVWRCPDEPARRAVPATHPGRPSRRRPGDRLLPRAIRAAGGQPRDDPRPEPERAASRHPSPERLDVTAVEADVLKPLPVDRTVRVGRPAPGDPLPARADVAQGCGRRERGRVLAPTGVLFGASVLGTSGSHTWLARRYLELLQLAGRLRQSRRHRGRAPRDPRGVVRARGARGHRLDHGLRGYEAADERSHRSQRLTTRIPTRS